MPRRWLGPRWELPRRILRSAAVIAVPSSLWIAFRASTQNNVSYRDALLAGGLFHPLVQGYWFVDALVQLLLLMALLFAVPAVRRLEVRHPFGLPCTALVIALLARLVPGSTAITPDLYSTHLVLWLFVLGWLIHRAHTPTQRWITAIVVLLVVPPFFGSQIERAVLVASGLLILLLIPRLRLPRGLATTATALASASLGIYLTHFALLPLLAHGVPSLVLVPLALALGLVAWWTVNDLIRRALHAHRLVRTARIPSSPALGGHRAPHLRSGPAAEPAEPPADHEPASSRAHRRAARVGV